VSATASKRGDRITSVGPRIRAGVITEVLGTTEHEHYLVSWDDGKTSLYYPTHVDHSATDLAQVRATVPASATVGESASPPERHLTVEPGDRLVVHGHHLGERQRDAEILEVRGADGGAPFLVRWADTGQETLVYPGSDASVDHIVTRGRHSPST
jgi:uncharacterized protein DUF1918